jgi:hypothetical protein
MTESMNSIENSVEKETKDTNAEIAFVVVKNLDGTYRLLDSLTDEVITSRKANRLDIKLAAGEIYNSISNAESAEAVLALLARSQQSQTKPEEPKE